MSRRRKLLLGPLLLFALAVATWTFCGTLPEGPAHVRVPLPGHTPGNVGVFVNLSPSVRILHIGDTTMVKEGFERPAPKGWLVSLLDNDRAGVSEQLQLLKQLHAQVPELIIMPAHDRTAWEQVFGDKRCLAAKAPRGGGD